MINFRKPLLSFFVFAILFGACYQAWALPLADVCFDRSCFRSEVARSASEREHGLMGREKLAEYSGMLFAYPKEVSPRFWMKNTLIALDFVWMDAQNRVVGLNQNAQPCLPGTDCPIFQIEKPAQYVLEIPAGMIEKTAIKSGDQAQIKFGETV